MSTQCTTPNCVNVTNSLRPTSSLDRTTRLNSGSNHAFVLAQKGLTNIRGFVAARYEQHLDRVAFQQMLKLDEHMLKDIGITRADVIYANNLPISVDAAKEVERIARRNCLCHKL